jgi:UDP-N-acetylglucosamine:LPS N-acetylglucosamine transferase
MTTAMIWPDVQREDGHWLPAISLAKSLKDAGYQVRMMGIPDTAPIVAPYQVPFTPIMADLFPVGHARERLETAKTDLSYLLAIARGALDSVFTGPTKPHLLVAGFFAALEALIVHHKYNVPIVTFTTFLRHPDSSPKQFAKTTLLDLRSAVASKIISLATGSSTMTIDQFLAPLDTVKEIIAIPKDMDFTDPDWKHSPQVSYVEPMVTRVPLDGSTLPPEPTDYFRPLPPTGRLLYGAAGSQIDVFELSARQFFTSLIEMMNAPGLQNRHLVLSLGHTLYQEFKKTYTDTGGGGARRLPDNVSLAPWVPQLEILARADAVFLHGGLATIKESIWSGVPMVITPMVNDQFENALRLERLDLAVIAELGRLSPDTLREALTKVTSSPWFARSTTRMRQIFIDAENRNPKRSVEVIRGVVAP